MKNLRIKLLLPVLLIGIAWGQEIVDQYFMSGNFQLYVSPGGPWWGVITAPFSHSDWGHIIGNTLAFLPLSYLVLANGISHYLAVWTCVILSNFFVLFFWYRGYHGMSSVVYGLVGYLFTIGLVERRFIAIALTILSAVTYGYYLPTLMPGNAPAHISWIAHFGGFVAGIIAALGMFREGKNSPRE